MHIKRFALGQMAANCYVVFDDETKDGVIIDPGVFSQMVCNYILNENLNIKYILLTHGHFDHVCGAAQFAGRYGADIVIGKGEFEKISFLNSEFGKFPEIGDIKSPDTVSDGDILNAGSIKIKCVATPGHTCGGFSYVIDENIFSGDTLFRASIGRTDFYSGNFVALSESVKKLYRFPDTTAVYPGHGFSTTIGYEKKNNPSVKG